MSADYSPQDLFTRALWWLRKGAFYQVTLDATCNTPMGSTEARVPAEAVHALHPQLEDALSSMLARNIAKWHDHRMSGAHVLAQLQHLTQPVFVHDKQNVCSYQVYRVYGYLCRTRKTQLPAMQLTLGTYDIGRCGIHPAGTCDDAVRYVELVESTARARVNLTHEEVDQTFPGWQNRMATAKALDLTPDETTSFVFQLPPLFPTEARADLSALSLT